MPKTKEPPPDFMGLINGFNTKQQVSGERLDRQLDSHAGWMFLPLGISYTSLSVILHGGTDCHLLALRKLKPYTVFVTKVSVHSTQSKEELLLVWSGQDRPDGQLPGEECE